MSNGGYDRSQYDAGARSYNGNKDFFGNTLHDVTADSGCHEYKIKKLL